MCFKLKTPLWACYQFYQPAWL